MRTQTHSGSGVAYQRSLKERGIRLMNVTGEQHFKKHASSTSDLITQSKSYEDTSFTPCAVLLRF